MRIHDAYSNVASAGVRRVDPSAAKASQTAEAKKTTATDESSGVKVTVSSEARVKADALAQSAQSGRSERIAALKAQVRNGSYEVDAEKISAKLVGD